MTELMTRIYDAVTGDVTEVPYGASELAQNAADLESQRLAKEEAVAKATARQAVLDRLGLTQEEAQLILGGSN